MIRRLGNRALFAITSHAAERTPGVEALEGVEVEARRRRYEARGARARFADPRTFLIGVDHVRAVVALVLAGGKASLGPSSLHVPSWDSGMFWTALTVLAIPQVPLSFANSLGISHTAGRNVRATTTPASAAPASTPTDMSAARRGASP